ncbi:MAG: CDP-alcohol phosphatidyltransferase family protein [Thermoplasmatales archaeon]|nr:CDP-alcohol phosphatidyltransferase family protein [Thermoplasmatales archaeon]
MVLNNYRSAGDRILTPIARPMKKVNPDILSVIAFLFAFLAGLSFYLTNFTPELLLLAALFIFLNAFFDALDGIVAKISGKASKKGDFLDHVLDRYADVFILGGITLSIYCNNIIGLFAVVSILLASYLGTQAQAVGAGRIYSGVLGRADRLVILIALPLIQYMLINQGIICIWKFTFVEWVMIYFAVAGQITVIQRFFGAWKMLKAKG